MTKHTCFSVKTSEGVMFEFSGGDTRREARRPGYFFRISSVLLLNCINGMLRKVHTFE